ncbi:MAG: DNA polymerase I [Clostridia bacterium]|nr:DNA polymerase I [Clostridia bacterium]
MEKLVLIDGNSLINRAFYATPLFTTKSGTPTNGVFGFVKLMLKIVTDKKPSHFAVAFDLHAPTFRHKMYADYKAGRKPMPEDLALQLPILKEVLRLMNVKICELQGYEADDVLGTLAKKFNVQTYIYTGDRDSYQLVDETTNVCYTRKGVSDILELSNENFQTETGLTPSQIIDLKALMGDKSDNIPGVVGVGEKSATLLIHEYGNLESIYEHIDEIGGALHKKLEENKETAFFSKQLATIDTNVPLDIELNDCALKMPFSHLVREKFAELEFKSLISMNIFAETKEEVGVSSISQNDKPYGEIEEKYFATVNDAVAYFQNSTAANVACYWSDAEFSFTLVDDGWRRGDPLTECIIDIKRELLDSGFFEDQLQPLFKAVFGGKKRLISYNIKDIMHRAKPYKIDVLAPFEDVAILKCISEGLANTDDIFFCMNYFSLPEKYKAHALVWMHAYYAQSLNDKERELYQGVELPLVRVLFDMELQGVCVNEEMLKALSLRYQAEKEELKQKIYALAGEEFNVNSTQQLGKILFEKLQVGKGTKKTKERKNYKTTAEELEKYAGESEIVRLLLRYRRVQKIHSTYIEGIKPLIKQGKVHTTYNQNLTSTGRLSSSNPNLQNIPIRTEEGKELRKLFMASEGNVLVDADYSQIELRLLAHFSGCKELIKAYCQDEDIHALTASQVFGVPSENVSAAQRRQAKAVNFGIIYGISAFGLGSDLNISAKRAQEYINKYFQSYSDVQSYMQKNVNDAQNDGYVTTLLGRRRVINEIRSSNYNLRSFGERAAMNMPMQGSSADIIKLAMINVSKSLQVGGYKAKLVLQVHDELVIDCPKEEADAVSKILKREMENAVSLSVPLTVEVGVGKDWFDSKA